jgi:hypothetical protein
MTQVDLAVDQRSEVVEGHGTQGWNFGGPMQNALCRAAVSNIFDPPASDRGRGGD